MDFPTKVQLIKRKESEHWYINFPSAIAQAMEFKRGETVEWTIDRKAAIVHQPDLPDRLEALIEPLTRGDPESALRWTVKGTRQLA